LAGHQNFQVERNKATKGNNVFKRSRNLNKDTENLTKSEKLMNGVALWASYYRKFPHIFVKDYLGVNLKLFQQILIYFMMHFNYFMYLASRGQGKTFLTAIFCCVRAILFPESKIIVASGVKSQAREVLEKIADMRTNSPNLDREIKDLKTGSNDAVCLFHNGSWIKIVASNDNARSKRSNVLVVDEFRMVDLDVINKVLRKFQTAPRQPKYLDKPEYAHLKERNKELYLSSCWYKFHWSWEKVKAFFKSMVEGKSYFVCGLPYQLAIRENLLDEEQVKDEMSESDFDAIGWLMEMECLFFGESDKAFFKFEELEKNRVLPKAIYPKSYYNLIKDKNFKYEEKKTGEIRLISCDVAGMKSTKKGENDASVFTIMRLIPNKTKVNYDRHVVYMESLEGGHTVTQAIRIRQLYDEFECDYIVLDTAGYGLGIYDQLCQNLYDKELQIEYEAFGCMNDEKMHERCLVEDAPKKIYSLKATAQLNSEGAVSLKDSFKRNKTRLLVNENEGNEYLSSLKGFEALEPELKVKLKLPYVQQNLLVNEMINLENVTAENSQYIKLKEPRSGRKDRYSSVVYANYVGNILERELRDYFIF